MLGSNSDALVHLYLLLDPTTSYPGGRSNFHTWILIHNMTTAGVAVCMESSSGRLLDRQLEFLLFFFFFGCMKVPVGGNNLVSQTKIME